MHFTCFGQDQNGNYGNVDQSFESLRFQVLLGPDGTEYNKDLSRLLISMEHRYNKDEKYDPDLLIDYPRKGQVCAVLQRTKEQKEDQCFRGKTQFFLSQHEKNRVTQQPKTNGGCRAPKLELKRYLYLIT